MVAARLEMHVAVLQQAGQVAEVADGAQTLQLLRHVALLPAAVAPPHLDGRRSQEEEREDTADRLRRLLLNHMLAGRVSLRRSTGRCTGTCSGVCRTPPSCLHSGCAASPG